MQHCWCYFTWYSLLIVYKVSEQSQSGWSTGCSDESTADADRYSYDAADRDPYDAADCYSYAAADGCAYTNAAADGRTYTNARA
ncbi:hypothetical protein KDH_45670 [Dictyobacter sp. S3.2.2.5]|uniref:Uncharacterized protein n=1 Tax=Dictyobacter halimunensis TaxID=3026934 RepID=A0ABQ6FYV7_9CHLR|nr:hypothetical protein KDH_45670 [Dictyobacter sp. S3.2.2.5]